ncbi:MAG: CDP-diacylglycerol--glycerol-3-phosphate 3-phosphatidyltransferase [Clostridium sp.]|uniref:CDP-diacylglycerol--glycerol-3-phosphate 3-phosphatidyltransferase n=1 Tax=Clostridium TaxID=1485 RepID=UPI002152E97A|nr:CDP-diacylglycerol--glycerol-3-phosphate 3-phosphatidyltransferase [Clostridium sp. LY3-2]MCR6515250.1 CDP-diacylglycerol--glycerol-3-phosphate 3-phosphatidyltransferase [Clostridium sp. LY3-2]
MNLANKLTLIRIVFVPLFLIFMIFNDIPYGTFIATIIFVLASITDKLDGYIARSRNQITDFGKFMDPLADKLLVTTALIALVGIGVIPSWTVVIIIAREFAVSGLRSIAAASGKVIAASWWGKIKTVIQMVAIILLLLNVSIGESPYFTNMVESNSILNFTFNSLPILALYLAVIVTVISGIDYFMKNRKIISTNK